MKIISWKHEGVKNNGIIGSGGAVDIKPSVKTCNVLCSCGTCVSAHKNRPYLLVNNGLKDGEVIGVTVFFDDSKEVGRLIGELKLVQKSLDTPTRLDAERCVEKDQAGAP